MPKTNDLTLKYILRLDVNGVNIQKKLVDYHPIDLFLS